MGHTHLRLLQLHLLVKMSNNIISTKKKDTFDRFSSQTSSFKSPSQSQSQSQFNTKKESGVDDLFSGQTAPKVQFMIHVSPLSEPVPYGKNILPSPFSELAISRNSSSVSSDSKQAIHQVIENHIHLELVNVKQLIKAVHTTEKFHSSDRPSMWMPELLLKLCMLDKLMTMKPTKRGETFSTQLVEPRHGLKEQDLFSMFLHKTTALCGVSEGTIDLLRHYNFKAVLISRPMLDPKIKDSYSCIRLSEKRVFGREVYVAPSKSGHYCAHRLFFKKETGSEESSSYDEGRGLMVVVTPCDGQLTISSVVNISQQETDPEEAALQQCFDRHTKCRERILFLIMLAKFTVYKHSPHDLFGPTLDKGREFYQESTDLQPVYCWRDTNHTVYFYYEFSDQKDLMVSNLVNHTVCDMSHFKLMDNVANCDCHVECRTMKDGNPKWYLVIEVQITPSYNLQVINWFNVIRRNMFGLVPKWISERSADDLTDVKMPCVTKKLAMVSYRSSKNTWYTSEHPTDLDKEGAKIIHSYDYPTCIQ